MKSIVTALFFGASILLTYQTPPKQKVFIYKTDDCVGMSVPEGIFFGTKKVGIVKTIKSQSNYCAGLLQIDMSFKVSCKMKFYRQNDQIRDPIIRIEVDSSLSCNGQVSRKDTIILFMKH